MTSVGSVAKARPHISVVVPCYCCEHCLAALVAELTASLTSISPSFELVLVDDRSPEADWKVIQELASRDPRVRGVRLARNFGQHQAIAAGLAHAEGDYVVVMDCDLQDPPRAIPELYAKAREGFHVVFARRRRRQDRWTKRLSSWAFAKLHGWLGGFDVDPSVGNFSIISRQVVLEMRKFTERNQTYGMMVGWLGFDAAFVDVQHGARFAGETSYTLPKQLAHAMGTILAQSTRPLYMSAVAGFVVSGTAGLYGLYLVARKLIGGIGVEGWTGIMVSLFFLSGVLMMNMGVLGLYLGNVFLDVKRRPGFVVETDTSDVVSDQGAAGAAGSHSDNENAGRADV
ncbi:MAG TPA: glycosyltransferase family 2 protein [Kofleriaceae bacterium]|jgi:dolichol-phosphate mannosyltransferase